MEKKQETIDTGTPKLFGLVLSGGTSARMGKDKGLVDYHGIPQREYVYHLLMQFCDDVFLSVRQDQATEVPEGFKTIVDQNNCKGPFNGILSAHNLYIDSAWLVVACDLPFMDSETLGQLIAHRNSKKFATTFANQETGLPEPLVCVWEPRALKHALEHLNNTDCPSPKRFLMQSDIAMLKLKNNKALFNANTVADMEFVQKTLNR
ncbi:NTP transferase domain-containing protein [Allomuricauda sp. F6463D]|uniref:NTP transferase domain-containing protein n=1 Tax=Allomuricauda sp. F6463D TaxID=2926409 RepID=UPI001FF48E1F|nr:NTP transferase domain-containing protein [Muricauda sp. F6463D]MCK0159570.1 NTP transferase domain-containing protein [Muricauda sp. F6463D]